MARRRRSRSPSSIIFAAALLLLAHDAEAFSTGVARAPRWEKSRGIGIAGRGRNASPPPPPPPPLPLKPPPSLGSCWFVGSDFGDSLPTKTKVRVGATELRLFGRKSTNDNGNDDETRDEDTPASSLSRSDANELLQSIKIKLTALLPPSILDHISQLSQALIDALPKLRLAFASFTVGLVLATVGILYPVFSSIEESTTTFDRTFEPVMLFETILSDLDSGYVDKVDTTKLFETGVTAMLNSLDPYTEFEGKAEAAELNESVQGVYGGVGLVISGMPAQAVRDEGARMEQQNKMEQIEGVGTGTGAGIGASMPSSQDALNDANNAKNVRDDRDDVASSSKSNSPAVGSSAAMDDDLSDEVDDDDETLQTKSERRRALARSRQQGIRVVKAFEGYAYDYGIRVGDKLVAVDGERIDRAADDGTGMTVTVEDVRKKLRGEPGTFVDVTIQREGVEGESTMSIPRTVVQISDVKLATLLGNKADGIGYVRLSGFSANAGREMRNAIVGLQRMAQDANPGMGGTKSLQGLVLDLRDNPGGLLTSAVDVASLLVPEGSDIVSAKGRGFPGILYRSRVDPILSPETKLAVLVNKQTASAAEIVSGAVQDLDVGVIVGYDRTFGKGLVQNVEELPFDTALKYTVAKYYTPSGRCIQSTNYREGGGINVEDGIYQARTISDKEKKTFLTKNGRKVKDGGGVAVDYRVEAQKASALEFTLLRSGVYSDFATQWSREHHQLTDNLDVVDDGTYKKFQAFVMQKQKEGDIELEAIYSEPIESLKKVLKTSGYKGTTKELEQLQANLLHEIEKDFVKYKNDIKDDVSQNILARYLPESMLLDIGVRKDKQVNAAVGLLRDEQKFNKLLGRTGGSSSGGFSATEGVSTAIASKKGGSEDYHVMLR